MSDVEISDRETSFSAHESDAEHLYDAIEIKKERKGQYLIKWDGLDPDGKPWPDSWANKRDCTDDIVQAWKLKKAQKKREQQRKVHKKLTKTRQSTVSRLSEGSKASTSRRTASVAPTARSLRSNDRARDDSDPEYESISHTPANRKKRRLSRPVSASPTDEDFPPPSSLSRPSKKRRPNPPERSPELYQDTNFNDEPPEPDVGDSDEEIVTVVQLKRKGKSVDRSAKSPIPLPRGRPPKKASLLQKHLNKYRDDDDDGLDNAPAYQSGKTPDYSPPPAPRGVFSLARPASASRLQIQTQTQTQKSAILSPRGQARLDRFDEELAAARMEVEGSQKVPLFIPASSEERDSLPPEVRSRSASRSQSRSSSPRSRSHSAPRFPEPDLLPHLLSPTVSDLAKSPSPRRTVARNPSERRAAAAGDDSYRDGEVPETQPSPSPSPRPVTPSAVSPSPIKSTLISKMKPRSRTGTAASLNLAVNVSDAKKKQKPLGPIPRLTPSQFVAQMKGNDHEGADVDAAEDADVEDVEDLVSSIEQFSSPVKGKRARRHEQVNQNLSLPEAQSREEEEEEEEAARARIEARGVQMAEAARAVRRAQMAEYDQNALRAKKTSRTLSQILKLQQQRAPVAVAVAAPEVAGAGASMSTTESDIPMPSQGVGAGPAGVQVVDVRDLRQEEEENTQDVMAHYRAAGVAGSEVDGEGEPEGEFDEEPPAFEPEDSGPADPEIGVGDDSAAEDELVNGIGNRSEDHESEPERYIDPEISAWNEEHSSPRRSQEVLGNTSLGFQDDSMEGNLPAPEVPRFTTNGNVAPLSKSKSKSRSTSAGGRSRSRKPADADIELPPTASTRQNTPEPNAVVPNTEATADPRRHLDAAMSLLNVKSEENHRLATLLADERALLEAERARNLVLQERVSTLELQQPQQSQPSSSPDDADLARRLQQAEELLAAERTLLAEALQGKAAAESERDFARRDKASAEQQRDLLRDLYGQASAFADEKVAENRDLEKRVKIAEEQTRDGITTIRATFDLREAALKSEAMDWRNQSNFLREQIVRSNLPEVCKRAAEHPELLDKCTKLVVKNQELVQERDLLAEHNESLTDRLECQEEDLRVKVEEMYRLERQVMDSAEEIATLKANDELHVNGDYQVLRCGWRAETTNHPCPALCRTQEDLDFHAAMHVTRDLLDPIIASQGHI
ncbi:hypothetical protein B0H11DRAFT_2088738 [Mycena galericulata]|nr:hypothetical protein B0H11DRAFT_2088738 [Mycena galericulata]